MPAQAGSAPSGMLAQRASISAWFARRCSRGAWLLLPPLLLLVLLFVLPLVMILGQSFSADAGLFSAYHQVLTDGMSLPSLGYTLRVAAGVTVLTLLLSYPVAFLIARTRGRWQMVMMGMVLVPFWTSAVIRSYSWLILLQRRGVVNEVLTGLGMIERPLRLTNTEFGLHLAMVQVMLPFMALPLINTMRGIDPGLLRAAAILGAQPGRQFLSVYLPLTMPGVLAGSALVFISTLGFYITPALLGSSGVMSAVLIEQQVSRLLDWPLASALATLMLVATGGVFLAVDLIRRVATGRGRGR